MSSAAAEFSWGRNGYGTIVVMERKTCILFFYLLKFMFIAHLETQCSHHKFRMTAKTLLTSSFYETKENEKLVSSL